MIGINVGSFVREQIIDILLCFHFLFSNISTKNIFNDYLSKEDTHATKRSTSSRNCGKFDMFFEHCLMAPTSLMIKLIKLESYSMV